MEEHAESFGWRRDEQGNLYRPLTPSELARIRSHNGKGAPADRRSVYGSARTPSASQLTERAASERG